MAEHTRPAGQSAPRQTPARAPHAASSAVDHTSHNTGRPSSWLAVVVMIIGFVVGGLGMVLGTWALFWIGIGVSVVGGIYGLASGIMEDYG